MLLPRLLPKLPPGVYVLSLCQGLGISTAVVAVSVAGLVGQALAPSPLLATVPYGLTFVAVIVTVLPASTLMGRFGRRRIFLTASVLGMAAGVFGAMAVMEASFALQCIAHFLLGCFLANVNLFRFAALDMAPDGKQSSAMSLVLFGGVFASLLGPLLVRNASEFLPLPDSFGVYGAAYGCITLLAGVVFILLTRVRIPQRPVPPPGDEAGGAASIFNRRFIFAMVSAGIGYGTMNLLMISASLEMTDQHHHFTIISYTIQLHVFCMYFPSLFAARVIEAVSARRYGMIGAVLLMAAGAASFLPGREGFMTSLILLGLAWNALYLGGTYLASRALPPEHKFRGQGINDMTISICSTFGALGAGVAITLVGWHGINTTAIALAIGIFVWGAILGGGGVGRMVKPAIANAGKSGGV